MKILLVLLSLIITKPADGPCVQLYLPGEAGIIVIQWKPNITSSVPSKPALIFNHFINKDGLLFRTHYIDYQTPVLNLSVGRVHHLRSTPFQFQRGQSYWLWAFYRKVGTMMEMGVFVDGRLIGYLLEPLRPYKSWKGSTYIGTRGPEPVNDPTFPSVCHADGIMSIWLFMPPQPP